MKSFWNYLAIAIVFILIGWFANTAYYLPKTINPIAQIKPTPLNKYTIENLSQTAFKPGEITIGEVIKDDPKFVSYKFYFKFSPTLSDNLKVTSGVINIPKNGNNFPVILMLRGYVDQKTYKLGDGTQPSARVFASSGFVTIAPDFLGYGESDKEAGDIFETRFQTYTTAATLLNTIRTYKTVSLPEKKISLDNNIFIWGHSNGGQIALTTLEITGANYPTVLWAPVSKPFPASILAFIDEADDGGNLLIKNLYEFNQIYNASDFSFTNYLNKIKAPIQINQGTLDTAVPYWWSDTLNQNLEDNNIDVTYKKYPGANHSLVPAWENAVQNSLDFYKSHLNLK